MTDFESRFTKDHPSIVLPPPINNHSNIPSSNNPQQKSVLLPLPSNITSWDYKLNNAPFTNNGYYQPNDQINMLQQQQIQQFQHYQPYRQLQQIQHLQPQLQPQLQSQQLQPPPQHRNYQIHNNSGFLTPISSDEKVSSPVIPNFNNDDLLLSSYHIPVLPPINNTSTPPHEPSTVLNNGSHYLAKPSPIPPQQSSDNSGNLNQEIKNQPTPNILKLESRTNKNSKSRKKKQCPECHLFFNNLSTHRSTHLNPSERPFKCEVCDRGFSRSNDLFRHSKRHWRETGSSQGAFKCPFSTILLKQSDSSIEIPEDDIPCHTSGIFSRCDTYKNHLKAIHFKYPSGTKKKDRNESSGTCRKCGKFFDNVDQWLDSHVATKECGHDFD